MRYMVGDIVEGTVTGIQPYGAFVSLDTAHRGLIHISQLKLSLKAVSCKKPRYRKKRHEKALPPMVIGFASLRKQLDRWIADAADKEELL